jgi:hypothetical protein
MVRFEEMKPLEICLSQQLQDHYPPGSAESALYKEEAAIGVCYHQAVSRWV